MPANAPPHNAPSVDEAPDGVLDPETIPARGATVRVTPYDDMAYRDRVYLFVGDHYTDDIPIGSSAVGKDVEFVVPANEFIANDNNILPIRYEVERAPATISNKKNNKKLTRTLREESLILDLLLKAPFESAAILDLSTENYVASVNKPPRETPEFTRMTREANWGTAPYVYSCSDESIATIHSASGEVTAVRNGTCTITATDTMNQTQRYELTIKGILELHHLTHSADWEGMKVLCMQAKVLPVSLSQIKRFWSLYYLTSGQVGEYLGWLHYPVWTGDELGAGTAWSYDLNGSHVNENASGDDIGTFHQAVGIKRD